MTNLNDPLLPRPVHSATRELCKLVELTGELPTVPLRVAVLVPEDEDAMRQRRWARALDGPSPPPEV